jgi:uncharacterized protein YjbI with pentapeptide repeats
MTEMSTQELAHNSLFQLLRSGQIEAFNKQRQEGKEPDLRNADLHGVDLRGLDAKGLDMSNCNLHQADLRDVDFSATKLEGASISGAKIACTHFPVELSAEEIALSLQHGTRMRYNR